MELLGHLSLEVRGLRLKNLLLSKVKNLLTHDPQDVERILALLLGLLRMLSDFGDKVDPGGAPLKLDNTNERGVEFGQQKLLLLDLAVGEVEDHLHEAVPDRSLVRVFQPLPAALPKVNHRFHLPESLRPESGAR